jgi:Flp pilus assembly protein TadD
MRRSKLRYLVCAAASVSLATGTLAVFAAGCGSDKKNPVTPHVPTAMADAARGSHVTLDSGQQVGVVVSPNANVDLSPDAKDAYQKGADAFAAGDLTTAKAQFADAASKSDKSGLPAYSLGVVLEKLGDTDGAIAAYKQAFDTDNKFEEAAGAYAVLLAKTGKGPDADAFMTQLQGQNPDSEGYLADLAEIKSINGDHTTAQQLAQQALKKQPTFAPAMLVIARDYYRQHRYDVALYALAAILDGAGNVDDAGVYEIPARAGDAIEARLLRGLIERANGARTAAMTDLAVVAQKRPDMTEGTIALGELRLESSNAADAQGPLEAAAKYAPNDPTVHNDLGDCYRLLGMSPDAKREFDTALALKSSFAAVHYNLGLLYLFADGTKSPIPGVTSPLDQAQKAVTEFSTFQTMAGPNPPVGVGDDVGPLLSKAKYKVQALAPPPPPPPPDDAGTGTD